MCGIAGIIRADGNPVPEAALRAMADALPHRGPDASGIWSETGIGFAHTRLSLFDLSDAAKTITGQVFGARGPEIYLYSQPRPIRTLFRSGGWPPQTLAEQLPQMLKNSLTPLERTGDVFSWDVDE